MNFLKKALVRRLQRVAKFLIKIFEEIALSQEQIR